MTQKLIQTEKDMREIRKAIMLLAHNPGDPRAAAHYLKVSRKGKE